MYFLFSFKFLIERFDKDLKYYSREYKSCSEVRMRLVKSTTNKPTYFPSSNIPLLLIALLLLCSFCVLV